MYVITYVCVCVCVCVCACTTSTAVLYLLSDSRVRRIMVPTTCCTRLALLAGDLLLHLSLSSIYLRDQQQSHKQGSAMETHCETLSPAPQPPVGQPGREPTGALLL